MFASCVMSVCMIVCLHEKLADRACLHGCMVARLHNGSIACLHGCVVA